MKLQPTSHRGSNGLLRLALTLLLISEAAVFAFTPLETVNVSAGAFVGGSATPLRIQHTPLSAGSPVTKEVLIMGSAGNQIPAAAVPFEASRTIASEQLPITDRKVRVTIRYRFLTREQFDGLVPAPDPVDLPVIEGPDPTSFAFQIPPNDFSAEILQYRIIADQLQEKDGQLLSVKSLTFPPITSLNTEPYVTVGIQANATQVIGANGGRFSLTDGNPADAETSINVPAGLFTSPTTIELNEIPVGSPNIPGGLPEAYAVYQLDINPPFSGLMSVSLLYRDFTYPQGQDNIIDGTSVPEANASILGWDGFMWRRLGGVVDFKRNVVTAKMGVFKYLAVVASAKASPEDRRPPQKIITPNNDGQNDYAEFYFGDIADNVKVEIMDIGGHRVRTIMSVNTFLWDGRNDSGEIVESGVYIYQFKVEGKLVSGLVAVAK